MFLIVIKAELAYTEHYYNNADGMQSKFLHCILSFSYNTPALVTSEGRLGQKLMAVTVFVCYTRKDKRSLEKLKIHRKPLQHQRLIDVRYDGDISAGTEWEPEITQQLETAQVILLLVSPDFIDSEHCYNVEMKQALERHERGEARVIPLILRPCFWRITPLGKLQALPRDAEPIIGRGWRNQDAGFFDVAQGIYRVVEEMTLLSFTQPPVIPARTSMSVKPEKQSY